MIDATGTRRRLQALAVMGHDISGVIFTTQASGTENAAAAHQVLTMLREGSVSIVAPSAAEAVAAAYRTLTAFAGPSQRARAEALRQGWHGPAAWDTWSIDDPMAEPTLDEPDALNEAGLHGEHIDEIAMARALRDGDARPLSRPERLEAVRRLGGLEVMTPGKIAHRLNLSMNVSAALCRTLRAQEAA